MRAFLSHASADMPLATKMYQWLRDQASSVWFDRVELRPGDPLEARISSGISAGDVFFVLVTEHSNASEWVQFETSKALELEKERGYPRVVPVCVAGAEVPALLSTNIHITIDPEQPDFDELIGAIFRDSHILDIVLDAETLALDARKLQTALHEYMRSDFTTARVRIANWRFNAKVMQIAEQSVADLASEPPGGVVPQDVRLMAIEQINRRADLFPVCLPIYWNTLADLVGQLATEIFTSYGKNLDALEAALSAIEKTWQYAHFEFANYLSKAIVIEYAERFGFLDIAQYMRRYDGYGIQRIMLELFDATQFKETEQAELAGSVVNHVADARMYLPQLYEEDRLMLQLTCPVNQIVDGYTWYVDCIPQILTRFLHRVAFYEAKPLQQLGYRMGFKREDYDRIGFA